MLLQHQGDRAPQPRHSVFVRGDYRGDGAAGKRLCLHFRLNDRAETIPGPRQIPDDDDPFGCKARHNHAHPMTQPMCHLIEGGCCIRVTAIGQFQQIDEIQSGRMLTGFCVITEGCPVRTENLPTAPAAARTARTLWVDRNMAKLPRHSAQAANQLAVCQHPRADAF